MQKHTYVSDKIFEAVLQCSSCLNVAGLNILLWLSFIPVTVNMQSDSHYIQNEIIFLD